MSPALRLLSITCLALLLAAGLSCTASAMPSEVSLTADWQAGQKIDLAVGLFDMNVSAEERQLSLEMRTVLFADLEFSDFFNLIDVTRHAGDFRDGFEDKTNIDFSRYYLIGTKGLSLGRVTLEEDQVVLTGRLYDSRNGEMVVGKRYKGPKDKWREMVHRFADEIVERFTGVRGIATTKILFINDSTGSKEVWMMDYDGHAPRRITTNGSINMSPQWKPDGSGFAWTSYLDGKPEVFSYDLKSGQYEKIVAYPGINSAPEYSPDGRKMSVTLSKDGNSEIYLGNADGTDMTRLTYGPSIETSAAWSPNGRELVFVSDRTRVPQIFIMDIDGLNLRRVTFDSWANDEPVWSPNGDLIAFSSRRWGATDICVMDTAGKKIKALTDSKGIYESPAFSPNGYHIMYAGSNGNKTAIFVMDLNGSDKRRLTFLPGSSSQPSWGN